MTTEETQTTRVLYVDRRDAKAVKTALEGHGGGRLLDKRYRMTPTVASAIAGGGGGRGSPGGPLLWRNNANGVDGGAAAAMGDGVQGGSNERREGRRRNTKGENVSGDDDDIAPAVGRCIAVPVTRECFERVRRRLLHSSSPSDVAGMGPPPSDPPGDDEEWMSRVVGTGRQPCPLSPAATQKQKPRSRGGPSASAGGVRGDGGRHDDDEEEEEALREAVDSMTLVRRAIYETLVRRESHSPSPLSRTDLSRIVLRLDSSVCPPKLERLGDDTLVLPGKALLLNGSTDGSRALRSLLLRFAAVDDEIGIGASASETLDRNEEDRGDGDDNERGSSKASSSSARSQNAGEVEALLRSIHREIVRLCNSRFGGGGGAAAPTRRLVRRGEVDPDSPTRRSGHVLLYHVDYDDWGDGDDSRSLEELRERLAPDQLTGPGSPGWITVKEHGIRQSFDLTRVMFSRGNVTEKRRFGSTLVRPGEVVLDMYAGIGYYVLPALILGRAAHVVACEWNPDAALALRHNLRDNGVAVAVAPASASAWASGDDGRGRATVLEGDCRVTCGEFEVVGAVDRVSLGLLPSSEGGWTTAVRALRADRGGWLHVHGNVPSRERGAWAAWVCGQLVRRADGVAADGDGRSGWVAWCGHVERVKSYAPRVDHLVADIYVGPPDLSPLLFSGGGESMAGAGGARARAGFIRSTGEFVPSPESSTVRPSCALGPGGVLHQEWMKEDASGMLNG